MNIESKVGLSRFELLTTRYPTIWLSVLPPLQKARAF